MTPAELKLLIANELTVPVTQVAKIINSFNATVDFITQLNTDDIPDWTALLTFQTDGSDDGKYCKHPDTNGLKRIFETKIDNNTGNEPPTNPAITEDANWKEISASAAAAIPEWTPGVYGPGLVIVYHNHSTTGPGLFILLVPTRPFTSANIETELTGGQWAKIAGGKSALINIPVSLVAGSPNTVTLDMNMEDERKFVTAAPIGADFTLSIVNDGNAVITVYSFELSAQAVITMPSNIIATGSHSWNDDDKELTLDPGKYTISFVNRGSEKELNVGGPYDGISSGGNGITETSDELVRTLTPINATHFYDGTNDGTWTLHPVTATGIRKTITNISAFTLTLQGENTGEIRAGGVLDTYVLGPDESITLHTNGTYHIQI